MGRAKLDSHNQAFLLSLTCKVALVVDLGLSYIPNQRQGSRVHGMTQPPLTYNPNKGRELTARARALGT